MTFALATIAPPSIPHTNQITYYSPGLHTIHFPNPTPIKHVEPIASLTLTLHLRRNKAQSNCHRSKCCVTVKLDIFFFRSYIRPRFRDFFFVLFSEKVSRP